jgi:hypothetical protein
LLVVFVNVPISVAVAVLRHDLYDVDRLLSRAISYVALTASLTLVYAVGTAVLGLALGRGSALAVALATALAAAAFGPLRRRLQDAVDAAFDRNRRRALREVEQFIDAVRAGAAG